MECRKLCENALANKISRAAAIHMFKSVDYFDQGDTRRETDELEMVLRESPKYPRAYTDLGAAYGRAGDHDRAVAKFREALQHDSNYAFAHFNLGVAHAAKGLEQEAIEYYKTAVRLDDELAEAHNNLAFWYARTGEMGLAKVHRNRAIELGYVVDLDGLHHPRSGSRSSPLGYIMIVAFIASIVYFIVRWWF